MKAQQLMSTLTWFENYVILIIELDYKLLFNGVEVTNIKLVIVKL